MIPPKVKAADQRCRNHKQSLNEKDNEYGGHATLWHFGGKRSVKRTDSTEFNVQATFPLEWSWLIFIVEAFQLPLQKHAWTLLAPQFRNHYIHITMRQQPTRCADWSLHAASRAWWSHSL